MRNEQLPIYVKSMGYLQATGLVTNSVNDNNWETIKLSRDQIQVLEEIPEWCNSRDRRPRVLMGAAGTGKTSILRSLVRRINKPVILLAPTNTACEVLHSKTGMTVKTIHSHLNIPPEVDYKDVSRMVFNIDKAKDKIMTDHVYVVDEASMVPDMITDKIEELCRKNHARVLWIGDIEQIRPVEQTTKSRVFNLLGWELTTVHRQKKGSLLDMITNFRLSGVLNWDQLPVLEEVTTDHMIVCYTNHKVDYWNSFLCPTIKAGTRVLFYDNIKSFKNGTIHEVQRAGTIMAKARDTHNKLVNFVAKRLVINGETLNIVETEQPEFTELVRAYKKRAEDAYAVGSSKAGFYYRDYKELLADYIPTYYGPDLPWRFMIKPAYAMTAHKLQGKTLESIALDKRDLLRIRPEQIKELLYVALSRASKTIYQL